MNAVDFFCSAAALTPYQPVPPQVPAREGFVATNGGKLAYWDTGGDGQAIVLVHPITGSARMWLYQQPAFAAAGYRVIAYSRRGHAGSDPVNPANPGSAADDLRALLASLGLTRAHIVSSAAGGMIALDYTLSFPETVRSLVFSSSIGGIVDADYVKRCQSLRPVGFENMPSEFREIGPSYRAAYPQGVAEWLELERGAVTGTHRGQLPRTAVSFANLRSLQVPVLLMTGAADLWQPPEMLRPFAQNLPHSEVVIVNQAGHALYWETPGIFNEAVLHFISRNRS
jgi:pimeloyl-ACP methyl ester carboxylesterase